MCYYKREGEDEGEGQNIELSFLNSKTTLLSLY